LRKPNESIPKPETEQADMNRDTFSIQTNHTLQLSNYSREEKGKIAIHVQFSQIQTANIEDQPSITIQGSSLLETFPSLEKKL
jgi:hypothetical protein